MVTPGPDGDDGAGQFVSQDLRRIYVGLENFLDVGAADAAGRDFNQDFAVANFRDGNLFDADATLFAIYASVHGLGHGAKILTACIMVPVSLMRPPLAAIRAVNREC